MVCKFLINISLVNIKVKGIDFLIIVCAWINIYTSNLIDFGGIFGGISFQTNNFIACWKLCKAIQNSDV